MLDDSRAALDHLFALASKLEKRELVIIDCGTRDDATKKIYVDIVTSALSLLADIAYAETKVAAKVP